MIVFKGSLYIFNFLCGIVPSPCQFQYPFPDTSGSEPTATTAGPPPQQLNQQLLINNNGSGNRNIYNNNDTLFHAGIEDAGKNETEIKASTNNLGNGNEDNSKNQSASVKSSTQSPNNDELNQLKLNSQSEPDSTLIVQTTTGTLRGYSMKAVGGNRILAFEGIPYAEPPLNDKRFKPPIPVEPWDGILEANLPGPKCLQYNDIILARVIGSENCLYLNIYTKELSNPNDKLPVIIYIHGGGFLTGSGNDFGPAYLLQRDAVEDISVILVTINYRLGVMGFLTTADENCPGNYGLKDQSLAINWIYENISNFGGNPGKIILMGHGAGGAAVHFHMMANHHAESKGKFSAGISISGTAFNSWALHNDREQALNLTKRFAKSLRCSIHGKTETLMRCLRERKGSELVKAQIQFLDTWPAPLSLFRPVVEQEYQIEDPFLTHSPEEAYGKGKVDLLPWICGQAEDEGYSFLISHLTLGTFATLRKKWNSLAADFLNYNELPIDQDEITRRINWLYFRRTGPDSASMKTFSDALGARLIYTGIHKALQAHSQFAPTYAFMFGYKGKYNLGTAAGIKPKDWAVGHGEVLGYIFNSTNNYPGFQKNDTELLLSKILVNLFGNFAKTNLPTFTTQPGQTYHVWDRITDPLNMTFLHIDQSKNIKMIPEPYLKQTLYWESLGLPDSLPLANFSIEIKNVKGLNNVTGLAFVSTLMEGSMPDALQPPFELIVNETEQNNGFGFFLRNTEKNLSSFSIGSTMLPPSSIPTLFPYMGDFVPSATPYIQAITTEESLMHSTSPKSFRWIAQDFTPPPPSFQLQLRLNQVENDMNNDEHDDDDPPQRPSPPPFKPLPNFDPNFHQNFISSPNLISTLSSRPLPRLNLTNLFDVIREAFAVSFGRRFQPIITGERQAALNSVSPLAPPPSSSDGISVPIVSLQPEGMFNDNLNLVAKSNFTINSYRDWFRNDHNSIDRLGHLKLSPSLKRKKKDDDENEIMHFSE